jgi:hypothetical protein
MKCSFREGYDGNMISKGQDKITTIRKYWKVDEEKKDQWNATDLATALQRAADEYAARTTAGASARSQPLT